MGLAYEFVMCTTAFLSFTIHLSLPNTGTTGLPTAASPQQVLHANKILCFKYQIGLPWVHAICTMHVLEVYTLRVIDTRGRGVL